MYHTIGFRRDDILNLCAMIHTEEHLTQEAIAVPPSLGLYRSVVVTLTYLRRNHVQQALAETHGVSQPTISRAITTLIPVLAHLDVLTATRSR